MTARAPGPAHQDAEGARATTDQPAVRLIASDLDGTLLSPDGTVSRENREAILAAAEHGIIVMAATGRPARWLEVLADVEALHPVVVASNGAALYDLAEQRVVGMESLPADVVGVVLDELRADIPGTRFAIEHGLSFGVDEAYEIDAAVGSNWVTRGPVESLMAREPFVKLLVQHGELSADALAHRAAEVIGDRLTVTHSAASHVGLIEVSAAGVTKASGLAERCAALGIDRSEVAAFGDMPNDSEMLAWAGHPHVMGNAHRDLLSAGVRVIGTNAESSVGRTIRTFLGDARTFRGDRP